MEKYDSYFDTVEHKKNVENVMNVLISELEKRKNTHDNSKLEEPEKSCYDTYIPLLKKTKYGTVEYDEVKEKMEDIGLNHHYKVNRHHPEHFENGIRDMTLVDIVEMFCDHYAASLRSDTTYDDGIKVNSNKYQFGEALEKIFLNTYYEYFY